MYIYINKIYREIYDFDYCRILFGEVPLRRMENTKQNIILINYWRVFKNSQLLRPLVGCFFQKKKTGEFIFGQKYCDIQENLWGLFHIDNWLFLLGKQIVNFETKRFFNKESIIYLRQKLGNTKIMDKNDEGEKL